MEYFGIKSAFRTPKFILLLYHPPSLPKNRDALRRETKCQFRIPLPIAIGTAVLYSLTTVFLKLTPLVFMVT